MYQVLQIPKGDLVVEEGRVSGWRAILKRLDAALPFILYREPSAIWRALSDQLRGRGSDAMSEWDSVGVPRERVEFVLGKLQRQMKWPNAYFLPGDLLHYGLLSEYGEDDWQWFLLEINDAFGKAYGAADFRWMIEREVTVGEFIRGLGE